jgi:hypothetical protein
MGYFLLSIIRFYGLMFFDFHAYQIISTLATSSVSHNSNPYAVGFAIKLGALTKPRASQTIPTMMFAQRFIGFFRVTDKKAITNGTHIKIAMKNSISGLTIEP